MKNQNELDKRLDRIIDNAEKDIDKVHGKRLKVLLNQLRNMYEKYESNGELKLADMTKFNRLQKEVDFITEQINDDYKYLSKYIQDLTEQQYIDNYFQSAYLFEYEAQKKLGFGKLNKDTIRAAIENPIKDLTLPVLMAENRKQIIKKIRTELTQGLQAGESYGKMSKRIKGAVGFSKYKSQMVARTEAHRSQQIGRMDAAEQASKNVDMKKMWDASLDSGTRDAHQELDGTTIGMDEDFESDAGGYGPAPGNMNNSGDDINCRCTVVYVVNDRKPEVKRARQEDGTNKVIPYTNYEDWKKNRIN